MYFTGQNYTHGRKHRRLTGQNIQVHHESEHSHRSGRIQNHHNILEYEANRIFYSNRAFFFEYRKRYGSEILHAAIILPPSVIRLRILSGWDGTFISILLARIGRELWEHNTRTV